MRSPILSIYVYLLLLATLLCTETQAKTYFPPISGHPVTVAGILPADVLARVNFVAQELELIRVEMGKPVSNPLLLNLTNSKPHDVYFRARALFLLSDRLAYELTGVDGGDFEIVDNKIIRPFHVWQQINAVLVKIQLVKDYLEIPEKSTEKLQTINTKPDDVYAALDKVNHEMNGLLARQISPGDVYRQVTRAVYYASGLLSRYNKIGSRYDEPDFERGKTPRDVYQRLLVCYEIIYAIAKSEGYQLPVLQHQNIEVEKIKPYNVLDVAALIVGSLDSLYRQEKNSPVIRPSYEPGFKVPSNVYQRAGLLEQQLRLLQLRSKQNPGKIINSTP